MQGITAKSFVKDDPRVVSAIETAFLFLRGESSKLQLITGHEEVFGRNQIRLRVISLSATDMLGSQCAHCAEVLEDPSHMVVVVQKAKVKTCLHEGCFRKWFIRCDKKKMQPYRFLIPKPVRLTSGDPMTHIAIAGNVFVDDVDVSLVEALDFKSIRESDERGQDASEKLALQHDSDRPGINLFLCPRCTAPQEIPFLDTEDKVHKCSKCGGSFQVIVREMP